MLRFPSSKILSIISRYDSKLVGFIWGVVVVCSFLLRDDPFFPDFVVVAGTFGDFSDFVAAAGTL